VEFLRLLDHVVELGLHSLIKLQLLQELLPLRNRLLLPALRPRIRTAHATRFQTGRVFEADAVISGHDLFGEDDSVGIAADPWAFGHVVDVASLARKGGTCSLAIIFSATVEE
jgi:hypothetical protein